MEFKYQAAPHCRLKNSTSAIMMHLTIGLLVVYLASLYRCYCLGEAYLYQAIILMLVSNTVAIVSEAIWAKIHHKNVKDYLKTSFPWVTAIILTLTVQVNTDPYALGVATFIAIFFGKLVFGGFGQNIFNPAAVGRAVIFASFAGNVSADLITSATPVSTLAKFGQIATANDFSIFLNDFGGIGNLAFGMYQGALGETFSILIILVGIYFVLFNVIDWRIPFTYLGVLFLGSLLVGLNHGLGIEYALYSVLTGGAIFGAVFMLTDPVTSPTTRVGKIIFASFAAFVTIAIRYYANLPEGVIFSILLANIMTAVIDKALSAKQVDNINKLNIYAISSVVLAVVGIFVLGLGLTSSTYQSVNQVVDFESSGTLSLSGNYDPQNARVERLEENVYRVTTDGYGMLDEELGGGNGENGYSENVFDIIVENAKVKNIKIVNYGDTVDNYDKSIEAFLKGFIGKGINDSVDFVSSATITSKSAVAAVQAALMEASK